ncbi:MAG TPA: class I SAM-dependent methyltransferase [Candidatus Eremiobacteraceae bacterium]|nr:class I SAM-dependent methyltransferase [Candidatus Eremiobacteraceae bacterium]
MSFTDGSYTGKIPEIYDSNLGKLLFVPYAEDVARRAKELNARRILEIAAGTGIVTEALARALPDATIEATDLNHAMIDFASSRRANKGVKWSVADAQQLPFDDKAFDLVVCQFGAMFFPDRAKAFREARRVLAAGGAYIVSLWEGLQRNDVARIVSDAARSVFPDDPPLFLERAPYGHGDPVAIERELRAAGFSNVAFERVEKRTRGSSRSGARGYVEGTPLRFEIEARDARRLQGVVEAATEALEKAYGGSAIDGSMSALVFTAKR